MERLDSSSDDDDDDNLLNADVDPAAGFQELMDRALHVLLEADLLRVLDPEELLVAGEVSRDWRRRADIDAGNRLPKRAGNCTARVLRWVPERYTPARFKQISSLNLVLLRATLRSVVDVLRCPAPTLLPVGGVTYTTTALPRMMKQFRKRPTFSYADPLPRDKLCGLHVRIQGNGIFGLHPARYKPPTDRRKKLPFAELGWPYVEIEDTLARVYHDRTLRATREYDQCSPMPSDGVDIVMSYDSGTLTLGVGGVTRSFALRGSNRGYQPFFVMHEQTSVEFVPLFADVFKGTQLTVEPLATIFKRRGRGAPAPA